MTIQLVDKSIKYSIGMLEDVPIKVEDLMLHVDFVVIEVENDARGDDLPIILGRPFMATVGVKIDIKLCTLSINVLDERREFKAFDALKFLSDEVECYFVGINDDGVQAFFDRHSTRKSLKIHKLDVFLSIEHS